MNFTNHIIKPYNNALIQSSHAIPSFTNKMDTLSMDINTSYLPILSDNIRLFRSCGVQCPSCLTTPIVIITLSF